MGEEEACSPLLSGWWDQGFPLPAMLGKSLRGAHFNMGDTHYHGFNSSSPRPKLRPCPIPC